METSAWTMSKLAGVGRLDQNMPPYCCSPSFKVVTCSRRQHTPKSWPKEQAAHGNGLLTPHLGCCCDAKHNANVGPILFLSLSLSPPRTSYLLCPRPQLLPLIWPLHWSLASARPNKTQFPPVCSAGKSLGRKSLKVGNS